MVKLIIRSYNTMFLPYRERIYVVQTEGLSNNTTVRLSSFNEALFYFYHKYIVLSEHHGEVQVVDGLSVNTNPMGVKSPMAKKVGAKNNKAKKLTPKKVAKKGKK